MTIPPIKYEDLPASVQLKKVISDTELDKEILTLKTEMTKAYKNTITNVTTHVESAGQLISAHYHYSVKNSLTVLKDFNLHLNIRENPIGFITTKGEVKIEISDLARKEIFVTIVESEIQSFIENLTEVAQGVYNSLRFQGIYYTAKITNEIQNDLFKRLHTLNLYKDQKIIVNIEEQESSVAIQNGKVYIEVVDDFIFVLICSPDINPKVLMNDVVRPSATQNTIKELNQQQKEIVAEDQQKYEWAGNVFDYLTIYTEDLNNILGVKDINLYKDGVRAAVNLCYAEADKWEDTTRKENFKLWLINKLVTDVLFLTKRVKQGEELFAGIREASDTLSKLGSNWRDLNPPAGFTKHADKDKS